MPNPADLRLDYQHATLSLADLAPSPLIQFQTWFDAAVAAKVAEPNAMTLATVDNYQQPDARIVLLKYMDGEKLGFYTNYHSQKATQIAQNPYCSIVFLWAAQERQVRIKARLAPMDKKTSTDYFQSRPLDSQLAAWASPQSQPITDRQELENYWTAAQQLHAGQNPLPLPPHWGGYFILPHRFEFWQGRSSRLHDRFIYTLTNTENPLSGWTISRLAP